MSAEVLVGGLAVLQSKHHLAQVTAENAANVPFIEHADDGVELDFLAAGVISEVGSGDAELIDDAPADLVALTTEDTEAADVAAIHLDLA